MKINEDLKPSLLSYQCPRGHEYEATEPFILTIPDLSCPAEVSTANSGPLCVYCYMTWLQVNLGTEELIARG